MSKKIFYRRAVALLMAVAMVGCSGGGSANTSASGQSGTITIDAPAVELGKLVLRHTLLDPSVQQLRIRGFDSAGNLIFGPVVLSAAPELTLGSIPIGVVRVTIDYLENGVEVGIFTALVDFSGGRTVLIVDPNWTHIQALVQIVIQPSSLRVPVGFRSSLSATGRFSDGTSSDLTPSVTWVSSNPSSAEVDSSATVRARAVGNSRVSATLGQVRSDLAVEVSAAQLTQLELAPPDLRLVAGGGTGDSQALGRFSDGTELDVTLDINWTSAADDIVHVLAPGHLQAGRLGITTLTAGLGGVTASLKVSSVPASLEIGEASEILHLGDTRQLSATAVLRDGTRQELLDGVSWQSSNPAKVEVNGLGLAVGSEAGDTTISASFGLVSASADLHVDDPRRFVYTLNRAGGVAAFEFQARGGTLNTITGSPYLPNVGTPLSITGTPDGRMVFVIGPGAIRTYFRDSATGALTQGPRDLRFGLHSARVDGSGQFLVFYDASTNQERSVRILDDGTFQAVTESAPYRLVFDNASDRVGSFFVQAGHVNTPVQNLHCFELGGGPSLTLRSSINLPFGTLNSLVARRYRNHNLLVATMDGNSEPDIALAEVDAQGGLSPYGDPVLHQKTAGPVTADLVATRVGPMVVVGGYNGAVDNAEIYHLTSEAKFTAGQLPSAYISLPIASTRVFTIPGNRYLLVNLSQSGTNTRVYDFLEGTPRLTWTGADGGNSDAKGLYQFLQPR